LITVLRLNHTLSGTAEGVDAVDDAILSLKRASALAPLSYSSLLASAAQAAATASGSSGSDSVDGLSEATRIGRAGKQGLHQLVQFGDAPAEEYVARIIVDDGDAGREGRKTVLNRDLCVSGFGSAAHPTYGRVVVLLFSDSFVAS
jgi:hypothetical protein